MVSSGPDRSQVTAVLGIDKAKPLARRPEGPALSMPAHGAGRKAGRDGEVVPAAEQRGTAMTMLNQFPVSAAGPAA
jgi:hypothetical protein